jgi:hypothetical protein
LRITFYPRDNSLKEKAWKDMAERIPIVCLLREKEFPHETTPKVLTVPTLFTLIPERPE